MDEQEKWIKGITAEVGTILGPNSANQFFTIKEVDLEGKRVLVRRAQVAEIIEGRMHASLHGPRSMAEVMLMRKM